jgi:hypothetical protein
VLVVAGVGNAGATAGALGGIVSGSVISDCVSVINCSMVLPVAAGLAADAALGAVTGDGFAAGVTVVDGFFDVSVMLGAVNSPVANIGPSGDCVTQ